MNEFDLINHYFDWSVPSGWLGVGDDAALIPLSEGMQLVISVDMLIEGRHFFPDVLPERLARKALAVNLSDLAAMGAKPKWFTLALALPEIKADWLARFSHHLQAMAKEYNLALVGGDTTQGALTISIQIAGEVPIGKALLRSTASVGEDVWISGPLGGAAAAVMHRMNRVCLSAESLSYCNQQLDLPIPRIALGQKLRGIASAAIDLSDGLISNLSSICDRSACGAALNWRDIPYPQEISTLPLSLLQEAVLGGGDDYELCFTAPKTQRNTILSLKEDLMLPLVCIGQLVPGSGVIVLDEDKHPLTLTHRGFDHFSF